MARSISKNRIIRTLFTKLAPFYDVLDPALTRKQGSLWRQTAVAAAELDGPKRILDAGCGTGLLTARLAAEFGSHCHIIAIDFCPAMAVLARQRIRQEGLHRRAEVKVENVEIMPYPENFFDAVFMAFALRFVSDIRVVLKEFYRVLKPGGRLVILELSLPPGPIQRKRAELYREYSFPAWARLTYKLPRVLLYPLHDALIYYPNADKLGRMAMRLGFEQIEYQYLKGGLATLHRARKSGVHA